LILRKHAALHSFCVSFLKEIGQKNPDVKLDTLRPEHMTNTKMVHVFLVYLTKGHMKGLQDFLKLYMDIPALKVRYPGQSGDGNRESI